MRWPPSFARRASVLALIALTAAAVGGCASGAKTGGTDPVAAVGAENQYADVISQIGGPYVKVKAVMSNPNTDPHAFESSPQVAQEVNDAKLVVENGLGYDTFMDKILQASPDSSRKLVDVQHLFGLPDSTANPHLWYKPAIMPAVAVAVSQDLSSLDPAHAAYFRANATKFDQSLAAWTTALAHTKATFPAAPVATTEPVADYLLESAGLDNLTPFSFQVAVMNGTDPSPQDVSQERGLLSGHKVKVFVYNQQTTDTLTESLLTLARHSDIPVVGVYETMPTPGYDYQSWMLAEVQALDNTLAHGTSAPKL